jgi:hypothetical protein
MIYATSGIKVDSEDSFDLKLYVMMLEALALVAARTRSRK